MDGVRVRECAGAGETLRLATRFMVGDFAHRMWALAGGSGRETPAVLVISNRRFRTEYPHQTQRA